MSQRLGGIHGEVSLDDKGLRRGVTSINRQLQIIKTQFDASAAKARVFGRAGDQLRTKSQSLARQIDLQKQKVALLTRAHNKYSTELGKDASATQKLAVQLHRARGALANMQATQQRVNRQLSSTTQLQQRYTKALGQLEQKTRLAASEFQMAQARARAFGTEMDRLRVNQQGLQRQLALQRQQVTLLSGAYKESSRRLGQNAQQTKEAAIRLNEARAAMARLQGDLSRASTSLARHTSMFARVGQGMSRIRSGAMEASVGLTMLTGALAVGLGSTIRTAMEFESAFAGVRKTVDASEKEFAALNQGIRDMAKTMPQSHEEIAKVAEVAGQLGIKKDDILKFTRTMVDMGVATNMSSEDAATSLARLANITQMPMEQIDRLGATVVHLGNNLAATEEEIVTMGLRIAGAGHQVNMTEDQILSFAGALAAVGIKAEAGGTAISRVMLQMQTDVAEGGKKLDTFAKVAGMSSKQFKKAFEKDAATAILAFIEGLGKMKKDGKNVVPVLKDLSLNEIRVRDALLRASGAGDLFRKSLKLGSKAWKENSALTKEAQERYKTAASQMKIFRNRINDTKITLANAFIPTLLKMLRASQPVIDGLEAMAEWFNNLNPTTQEAIGIFAAVTGGLLAFGGAIAGIVALANPVTGAIVGISLALGTIGASVYKTNKDLKKTAEDAERFGVGVSEGTKKAAAGFLDLRDQASANLAKLRYTTGAEAKKIVDETVAIFAQMGDKVVAELNQDKLDIQKAAASLLGEIPEQLEGVVEGITNTAIKAIDSQIKRIQEANETIRKGLVEYGGDVAKMPKQFAEAYNQALKDVDEGARTFAKKIGDLENFMERIQADHGKVTAKGALKWVEEIEKGYGQAEKAAKKWAKNQRETWEEAFANGQITRDQYELINKIVDEEEQKRINIAKEKRGEALEILRDSLSEEAYLYDVHTGEILTSQSDLLGQSEYLLKQRGKKAWEDYFNSMIGEGKKAEKALKSTYSKLIKQYGDLGKKSVDEMTKTIKAGGKQARGAAEFLAIETRDGFMIDLGDQGVVTVESFIKGIESGKYGAQEVALAHMNQLRRVYGDGTFDAEGLKVIQSFTEGLKGQDVKVIADQIGLDLKSKMNIDLGRYGQMTSKSFAQGLSDGTLSFDAVYAYFRTQIQSGMTVDLSAEGKQNIDTLRLGMQTGAIDAEEAAAALGLNIKSKAKVDLGPEGEHTVGTLVAGLQSGKISVETFARGIEGLLKTEAKADLSPEGKAAGDSHADGLDQSKPNVKKSAADLRDVSEEELGKSSDGDGGKKSATDFQKGLDGGRKHIGSSALAVTKMAEQNLQSKQSHSLGSSLSAGFASGIRSGRWGVMNAALSIASAAVNTIRRNLRIASPSRVFMGLGAFTAKGFEEGMRKRIPHVRRVGRLLSEAAKQSVEQEAPQQAQVQAHGAGTTINRYYTINVKAGAPQDIAREVLRTLRNFEALQGGESLATITKKLGFENLIPFPSLKQDSDGDGVADGWTRITSPNADQEFFLDPEGAQLINVLATTGQAFPGVRTPELIPVEAGATYTLSAEMKGEGDLTPGSTGTGPRLQIKWYNSSRVAIDDTFQPVQAVSDDYTRTSVTGVAPVDAVFAEPRLIFRCHEAGLAGTVWFRNAQLELGDTPTDYEEADFFNLVDTAPENLYGYGWARSDQYKETGAYGYVVKDEVKASQYATASLFFETPPEAGDVSFSFWLDTSLFGPDDDFIIVFEDYELRSDGHMITGPHPPQRLSFVIPRGKTRVDFVYWRHDGSEGATPVIDNIVVEWDEVEPKPLPEPPKADRVFRLDFEEGNPEPFFRVKEKADGYAYGFERTYKKRHSGYFSLGVENDTGYPPTIPDRTKAGATIEFDIPITARDPELELWVLYDAEMSFDLGRVFLNGEMIYEGLRRTEQEDLGKWVAVRGIPVIGKNILLIEYEKDTSWFDGLDSIFVDDIIVSYNIPRKPYMVVSTAPETEIRTESRNFSVTETFETPGIHNFYTVTNPSPMATTRPPKSVWLRSSRAAYQGSYSFRPALEYLLAGENAAVDLTFRVPLGVKNPKFECWNYIDARRSISPVDGQRYPRLYEEHRIWINRSNLWRQYTFASPDLNAPVPYSVGDRGNTGNDYACPWGKWWKDTYNLTPGRTYTITFECDVKRVPSGVKTTKGKKWIAVDNVRVSWEEAAGDVLTVPAEPLIYLDGRGGYRWVDERGGAEMPGLSFNEYEVHGDPGSTYQNTRIDPRMLDLIVRVAGDSREDLLQKVRELTSQLANRPLAVQVVYPEGDIRNLLCRFAPSGDWREVYRDNLGIWWRKVLLSFRAFQPFWYGDPITVDGLFQADPRWLSVSNPGDREAWSFIRIHGPINNPKVDLTPSPADSTALASFQINVNLPAGNYIVVDTRPGKKMVILDSGNNLYQWLAPKPQLFSIPQGDYGLRLTGSGTDTNTRLIAEYSPPYWGV